MAGRWEGLLEGGRGGWKVGGGVGGMVGGRVGVWWEGGGCEVGRKGVHASVASLADLAGA